MVARQKPSAMAGTATVRGPLPGRMPGQDIAMGHWKGSAKRLPGKLAAEG